MAFHMSVPGTQSTFLVSDSRGRRPLGGSRDGEKTRSLGSKEEGKGKEGMNMCVRKRVSGICLGVRRSRGVEKWER